MDKRKRSSNFSAEEKMRFLRILQENGEVIISKVTAHDTLTNRLKEEAWQLITSCQNATGGTARSTHTLKKLWSKLKNEAKVFKSSAHHQMNSKINDPVLELVIEITGRGRTRIEPVNDYDSHISSAIPNEVEKLPKTKIDEKDKIIENKVQLINLLQNEEIVVEMDQEVAGVSNSMPGSSTRFSLKRKQPVTNEKEPHPHDLATERVLMEKEKRELIAVKIKHDTELHNFRMQNENKLFELKEAILVEILTKLRNGDAVNPDTLKLATTL